MQSEKQDNSFLKDAITSWALNELKKGPVDEGKNCLDDDQIIGYVNHTLTKSEREEVYEHASKCMVCFEVIEDLYESSLNKLPADVLDRQSEHVINLLKNKSINVNKESRPLFFIVILLVISNIIKRHKYIFIALFVCVSVFSTSYYMLNIKQPSHVVIDSIPEHIKILPWERINKSFSFVDKHNKSQNKRAFAAGAWQKRKIIFDWDKDHSQPGFLSPEWPENESVQIEKWKDQSEYAPFYSMGEFCFESRIALKQNQADNFWKQQLLKLKNIHNSFTQHADKAGLKVELIDQRLNEIQKIWP